MKNVTYFLMIFFSLLMGVMIAGCETTDQEGEGGMGELGETLVVAGMVYSGDGSDGMTASFLGEKSVGNSLRLESANHGVILKRKGKTTYEGEATREISTYGAILQLYSVVEMEFDKESPTQIKRLKISAKNTVKGDDSSVIIVDVELKDLPFSWFDFRSYAGDEGASDWAKQHAYYGYFTGKDLSKNVVSWEINVNGKIEQRTNFTDLSMTLHYAFQ
ncbi:Uncharacterised protein [Bacteroides heparinolyticus]|uniref:Lipoprotein n=1 Tax=Prevotella heparinolytica TaxID=28113 RepID=A0A449I7D5_9BACE|nr:hypothetical protein [Bacteroides heparinolyticus]VFB15320.1 Uncharacterised protein [Bacteroides heparinolyticus]